MDIAPIVIAYFIPIGIILIAWGSWDEARARHDAAVTLFIIALASCAYAALGFAFNFGGVGLRPDAPAGLAGLDRMWSPVGGADSAYWGVVGLNGFMLEADTAAPGSTALLFTLFVHQLPIVLAAALIPTLALSGRARPAAIVPLTVVTTGVTVALIGAWTWGGGWLFNLGHDAKFGHGFIDAGGAASIFAAAGCAALAALLALDIRRPPDAAPELPPSLQPVRSVVGALLLGLGMLGWLSANPLLLNLRSIDLSRAMVNLLLAASAAVIVAFGYGWFTTGHPNAQLASRGALAGLVAALAGAPFLPAWAAFVTGGIAGALLPPGMALVQRVLRLDDAPGFVAATGLAGLWSILAVGVLADGVYGAGWAGVGISEYLGVPGQGVTGLIAAANLPADPGQFSAQLTGLLAIAVVSFTITWLTTRPLRRFVYPAETADQDTTPR